MAEAAGADVPVAAGGFAKLGNRASLKAAAKHVVTISSSVKTITHSRDEEAFPLAYDKHSDGLEVLDAFCLLARAGTTASAHLRCCASLLRS